ncbi:hypothetical protein MPER_03930 [Moniliophthora perniciosa FA553]|nr:hypothetical protein MPER_03930 [Moniliophthora perniciosa FA553]
MYMGDSWDDRGSEASNYMWLPFKIDNESKKVKLQYHSMWKVDPETGVVSFPSTKKRYEAEDAHIKLNSRSANTLPAAIVGRCED